MSGFQGTNMRAGPLPVKETIYISTAPPAEPYVTVTSNDYQARPPEPARAPPVTVTVTNNGYLAKTNRQSSASSAGELARG